MARFEDGDQVKLLVEKTTDFTTYTIGHVCWVLSVLVDSPQGNPHEILYLLDAEPIINNREDVDLIRARESEIQAC